MNIVKNILAWLLVLAIIAGLKGVFNSEPTSESRHTTAKNSFLSGCRDVNISESQCVCAFDELEKLYPDFTTNLDRVNRIVDNGFNRTETDALTKCFSSTTNVKEI